jgi:hypothetical protein
VAWQSAISISGSATDNMRPAGQEPEAGYFTTISPRIRVAVERARFVFVTEYRFAVDLFANHLEATSYVNVLGFQGLLRISDVLRLSLAVEGSQGQQASLLLNREASATVLGVQPPGTMLRLEGRGFEHVDWNFSGNWTSFQDLTVILNRPLDVVDQPATLIAGNQLGAERRWLNDALAGVAQATYFISSYPITGRRTSQLITSLRGTWRHDFGHFLSGEAAAGAIFAFDLDVLGSGLWSPDGRLGLHYRRAEGWIEIAAGHGVEVNPVAAQAFMTEEAHLRAGLPILARPALALAASGGYQYGHALHLRQEEAQGALHVILADVSLEWHLAGYLSLGGRYQFLRQSSSDPAFVAFSRHVGLLSLTVLYPAEGQGRPIRAPSGRSSRVDGGDDLRDEVDERRSRRGQE